MSITRVLSSHDLDGMVLTYGSHRSRYSGLCAMEAVAWLAGESHSDQPLCACPVIGVFMRQWNDGIPDDDTRTRILRPLLPRLVGTRSTQAIEYQRSMLAMDWLARECAPAWLSLTDDLKAHAVALRTLRPLTDDASCGEAHVTLSAASAAARAVARAAASSAARAAAWSAASSAAWSAASSAARAAARAAAESAAESAVIGALAPTVLALQLSAVDLVQRMVDTNG